MGHTVNRVKHNGIFQNFVYITFNHSNYVIVGCIAKSLFSTYILGILKVNASYDSRHLEVANPADTFSASSSVRNAERFQSVPCHLLLCHSFTVIHICPLLHAAETVGHMPLMLCVHNNTLHLLQTTRNQGLTPYSQLSIVRYSPKHRERFPASRKFLWGLYQAQNVTVNFVWEANEGLVPDASVIG